MIEEKRNRKKKWKHDRESNENEKLLKIRTQRKTCDISRWN